MTQLTRDADKLICSIYKTYLERRKSGETKINATHFESDFYKSDKILSSWMENDVTSTLNELKRAGFVKLFIRGNFQIMDDAIIYMENRIKNGLSEITDFISKFIP